jgi:glycosyltransferase involved in cell wall biosynthesis
MGSKLGRIVGISLLTLVPGVSGGSETYARALVRALGRVGGQSYLVLLPSIATDVDGLPAELVTAYPASRTTPGRLRAMTSASVGRRVRGALRRFDVVHFPLTVMVPPIRRPPAVSSILDVQHEYFPAFFSAAERAYRRAAYSWTARLSRLVVTISHHAARTLVERLHIPEEKIHVIHLGLDHERFTPGSEARTELLVYPARAWPHKNHARLFEAFAVLRRRRPALELALPSYSGPAPEGAQALGWTPPEEVVRLYRTASALVFPSLYEGFGQPPLEAMACGCPVACSNAASLPEVTGDAARLFDPTSVEEMVAAVEDVLDRPEEYRRRGLRQAARFSWDETARLHDAVYREAGAAAEGVRR